MTLNQIFKSYIITKNKKPTRKYTDPENQFTLEQIKGLPEYAGILAEGAILVDIDNDLEAELLLSIIKAQGVKCRVHRTTRGIHAFFLGHHVGTTRTHVTCAIGLTTDWKLGEKNGISILKLDNVEREVIYETEEIGPLPPWLYPVKNAPDFVSMESGDGRNNALFQYILTLQSAGLTKDESRETIQIINKYILRDPLPDKELATILRDDAFPEESFFDAKGKLQVRKFEEHFSREVNAVYLDGNLHIYDGGVYIQGEYDIRGAMLKLIPDLTTAQRNEILNRMKDRIRSKTERASASLIVFRNGTYNMEIGRLEPSDPKNVITNLIDWNYNPDAYSEVTDKALDKLACHDPAIRALLEEMVGYCFYRRNELGKAFILLGENSNGKSTYLDLVRYVIGNDNIASLNLQDLNDKFLPADLLNKLANIGDDIPKNWVPDASMFKKVVTGSRISAQFKNMPSFQFNPYAKMLFSANEMPRIDDETGAVKRRLVPIPFRAKFSPDDPDFDPYIIDKLMQEDAVEYLIKVGIEGLHRVLKNKRFTTNKDIEKELNDIDALNNPILCFIDDNGTESIINHSTTEVYDNYRSYCLEAGMIPVARNSFVRQINARLKTESVRKMVNGTSYKVFVPKEGR